MYLSFIDHFFQLVGQHRGCQHRGYGLLLCEYILYDFRHVVEQSRFKPGLHLHQIKQ